MDQQGDESSEKSWGGRQVEHADKKKSNSATDATGKSCGASRAKGGSGVAAALMGPGPPCGACKFLRRKCISGCIFSPYFGSDQGAARFAAVHKVFGASNVSKLLLHIAANRRHDAMVTISYEAQARLSDPVYGCLSTILALRHQVAALQSELAMVQTQLMNSRLAVANALRNAAQQEQQLTMLHAARPGYSNTSSASNNLISLGNDNYPSSFDLADAAHAPAPARSFDLLQPSASSALARRRRGGKLPGFHSFRHPHPRPRVKQTYQLSYPL